VARGFGSTATPTPLANPRGYPMERVRGFDAALAVEV